MVVNLAGNMGNRHINYNYFWLNPLAKTQRACNLKLSFPIAANVA